MTFKRTALALILGATTLGALTATTPKPILACGMIKLDTTAQTVTVEGKLVDWIHELHAIVINVPVAFECIFS